MGRRESASQQEEGVGWNVTVPRRREKKKKKKKKQKKKKKKTVAHGGGASVTTTISKHRERGMLSAPS